jgi:hypothetical protein
MTYIILNVFVLNYMYIDEHELSSALNQISNYSPLKMPCFKRS